MPHKKLLQNISFPIESQIHVARHLDTIAFRFAAKMSAKENEEAERFLGSLFKEKFAIRPLDIIKKAIELGRQSRFANVNYTKIELEIEFSKEDFPDGIGWDSIVIKSKLSKLDLEKIEVQNRDGSEVQVIKNFKRPITWNLNIILHRNRNKWEVTTCFPGTFAPPLPHSIENDDAARSAAQIFWKEHLFV